MIESEVIVQETIYYTDFRFWRIIEPSSQKMLNKAGDTAGFVRIRIPAARYYKAHRRLEQATSLLLRLRNPEE